MNKWALGTILGSALLAVSKRSSGSSARRVQMPNNGICEMNETLLTELRGSIRPEGVEYLDSLVHNRSCKTNEECISFLEEFRSIVFGRRGDIDFTFPKSMINSFRLLSFDPGLSSERELDSLLREIVPKTWDQDKHNVRFFVQEETIVEPYWDDETEEEIFEQFQLGRFYDRLDGDNFEWNQDIPDGFGLNQVRNFDESDEYYDGDDQREIVLDNILRTVWTEDPTLRDRIIKFLYSLVIVHTLKSIKKGDTNWLSRNAGYSGEYMNNTYPNVKFVSNGFAKNLRGWDREEPRVEIGSFGVLGLSTENFNKGINYFSSIRSDILFKMLLSSEMTTNVWDDGVTKEFTITLKDLSNTVSFTARLDLGSLSSLAFGSHLDVPGYIETEVGYRTGWIELFAYVKEVETNSSRNHFINVLNKTPQWFQDWYRSRGVKEDKTKLRKR